MNPVARGIRNAFRNGIRTASIVLILGLSIGLSLTMLVAQKAVDNKIKSIKSSIGTTITIAPAGFTPGADANNALTSSDLDKVKSLSHVSSVTETLTDRLPTTGSALPEFGGKFGSSDSSDQGSSTSLTSPITLNSDGGGNFSSGGGDGPRVFISGGGGGQLPTNFSLPIQFLGTNSPLNINNASATLKSGKVIDGTKDTNDAMISSEMASKNSLSVGSTFTAYNATLTVAGIFNTDNQAAQGAVVISLPALQRLSSQTGAVTSATAEADSLDNLSSVTSAIKSKLGSNADVTSAQDQANETIAPLNSVKKVATFSLVGAVAAGAVIILLTMVMVVRERKKEIGVVKAIGGSNARIIGEFMIESLTLTILGAIIGLLIGVVGGQPVTKMLVDNSTSNANSSTNASAAGPGGRTFSTSRDGAGASEGGPRSFRNFKNNSAVRGIGDIKTQIGPSILAEGFGAAIVIAVLGSALAAGMISKVRPSTVMRAE